MITITFNAFSFLRKKMGANRIDCSEARMEVPKGTTVEELIYRCGLSQQEVEAVFLNNGVVSWDRELHHNDRVALVPPGTPGPYRVLLGMAKKPQQ